MDSSQIIMPHTPMDMNEEGRKILEWAALLEFLGGHLKRASE